MTQRLFPRIRTSLPVTFSFGAETIPGVLDNASLRGMRITAPVAPRLGTTVDVDLALPGGHTTRVAGKVVFVEPTGAEGSSCFALELLQPSEEYTALIAMVVQAQVRRGGART